MKAHGGNLSIILSLVFFLLAPRVQGAPSFVQSVNNQEMKNHGKTLYLQRCSGCHGVKGDGKGPAAIFLDPKPRDFTSGVYKFTSTPLEALPTDQDLMRTLTHGVLGTSMPAFPLVPEISRLSVIQYIKTFSKAWENPENIKAPLKGVTFPIDDFKDHNKFITRAKKGRGLFIENCVICHGPGGRGDGEGGEGLEDDWGFPIKPGNLTKKYIKSGKSAEAIYRVLLSGIAGTPMPSFYETIEDKDLWDVTAFVLYLRGKAHGIYGDQSPIRPITKEELE
jgi:cytochrome c oxidase cbb3-type subunit I/II